MKKILGILFTLAICLAIRVGSADALSPQYENPVTTLNKEEKVVFTAKTNLPEGTNVDVRLYQVSPRMELYPAAPMSYPSELYTLVKKGKLSGWFVDVYHKGLNAGSYEVCLNISGYQPHSALGKDNTLLDGAGVRTMNKTKTHTKCFPFSLEKALFPHEDQEQSTVTWDDMLEESKN